MEMTVGLLVWVVCVLASACESSAGTARAAPAADHAQETFTAIPLDEIPTRVSSLHFLKAAGDDRMINGYYDYMRPDILHVTHNLPRLGLPHPFDQYDIHLYCNRDWPPFEVNGDPLCDGSGKITKTGGRPICVYPEERHPPKGIDPMGAAIDWTDNGQCAMEFKHGLVSKPAQLKEAIAVVMDVASWMDRFVKPAGGPAADDGLENRRRQRAEKEIQ